MPLSRDGIISRSNLIDHLNAGLRGRLTLVSAPAGSGKTTVVVDWMNRNDQLVAWLSLDEHDNDPIRFLTYVISALQKVDSQIGTRFLKLIDSPKTPTIDSLMIPLVNDLMAFSDGFILVLDDYHTLDTQEIDEAKT